MFIQNLIECVRSNECLYNFYHADYVNRKHREATWNSISSKLNEKVVLCKAQWQQLRDTYRRSEKKYRQHKKRKGHESCKCINKWKLHDELSFLAPYISICLKSDRDSSSTDNKVSQQQIADPNELDKCSQTPAISDELMHDGTSPDVAKQMNNSAPPIDSDNISTMTTFSFEDYIEPTNILQENENNTSSAMNIPETDDSAFEAPSSSHSAQNRVVPPQYSILSNQGFEPDLVQGNTVNPTTNDDIDLFFASISSTVKKLSAFNQATAKARIFSIVSQLELEEVAYEKVQTNHRTVESQNLQNRFTSSHQSRHRELVVGLKVKTEE